MEVCYDVVSAQSRIAQTISRYGYAPEHNYYHYLYQHTPDLQTVFFGFEKKQGILAGYNPKNNVWYMLAEVLGSPEHRMALFRQFLSYTFQKRKAKKVSVEVSKDFRAKILAQLPQKRYRVSRSYSILYWPVYEVSRLDPNLPGRQWKKVRNIKNHFHSRYRVRYADAVSIPQQKLHEVLALWQRHRPHTDYVDMSYYRQAIDNNFCGFTIAQTISLNGQPCSISAGWQIPNSQNFYYAIGLQNYEYNHINDLANLNDLLVARQKGYRHVDLGGSDKLLLASKQRFRPSMIYKSYLFSIYKNRKH